MSTDLELDARNRSFGEAIAPLLKEYSSRLNDAMESLTKRAIEYASMLSLKDDPEKNIAAKLLEIERQRLESLLPGIERLARQTSQQLDHGVLDELSRIELEARLAELEGLLQTARHVQQL